MTSWKSSLVSLAGLVLVAAPSHTADLFAQADCSNTGASVSIASPGAVHSCSSDTVSADGSWSITNADGVQLTYSIESSDYQEESKTGSWGSWDFTDTFAPNNGWYTFAVEACPRVWNGSGYTVCLQHCDTASDAFEVDCGAFTATITECFFDCDFMSNECTGACDAEVENGDSPYDHTWCVETGGSLICENTQSTSSTSFTSPSLECEVGDPVLLDVEDDNGAVASDDWTCGFN